MFDRTTSARSSTISDKCSSFVVPFREDVIKEILQASRNRMVIFTRNENEAVGTPDFISKLFLHFAILMHHGWHCLIEKWEVQLCHIEQLKLHIRSSLYRFFYIPVSYFSTDSTFTNCS